MLYKKSSLCPSISFLEERVYPTEITAENEHGKKVRVRIDEKHIIFYSDGYARRRRNKKNAILSQAISMIHSPSKYTKAENYGALKYIKGMKLDKKTGELTPEKKGGIPVLDEALIKEEEKFDQGLYYDEVLECINKNLAPTLNQKYYNLSDIKN